MQITVLTIHVKKEEKQTKNKMLKKSKNMTKEKNVAQATNLRLTC